MTTTDRLLRTFDRKTYEGELGKTGLQDHQAEAIAEGVEKVSDDTDGYYGAMLKIWQGHDGRLDGIDGYLESIDARVGGLEKWVKWLAIGGGLGIGATIVLGVLGLVS